jgi:hypothetical protein
MKTTRILFGCALAIAIACGCIAPTPPAAAADGDPPTPSRGDLPPIIQNGFKAWAAKQNSTYAFDIWKKGGLLEDDRKPGTLADLFSRVDRTIGNYQSFGVVDSKTIDRRAEILYLSVNFEHAAAYGRFLLYRPDPDKDWVVQNIDFSLKPEDVMPWLAFAGNTETQ